MGCEAQEYVAMALGSVHVLASLESDASEGLREDDLPEESQSGGPELHREVGAHRNKDVRGPGVVDLDHSITVGGRRQERLRLKWVTHEDELYGARRTAHGQAAQPKRLAIMHNTRRATLRLTILQEGHRAQAGRVASVVGDLETEDAKHVLDLPNLQILLHVHSKNSATHGLSGLHGVVVTLPATIQTQAWCIPRKGSLTGEPGFLQGLQVLLLDLPQAWILLLHDISSSGKAAFIFHGRRPCARRQVR
mmetsp:Transcript_93091/g.199656  ORF Transcript_93091/g.199656 Transcript_93091/m.199656 type:complete len:250 (+) Transcript_93091:2141-2890(+)